MPTHYARIRVFAMLFLVGAIQWMSAQCDFVFDQDIPDNGAISLVLDVSDLVADDLSAGQSVCGVNLRFRHDYVGDLTIELLSPAGQTVKLVGPVTDVISPTNLTTWDIGFRQCGSPVAPDATFTDIWDNNQAWAVLASYSGTYYPSSGCLEDFNTGSANGQWTLTLTDSDIPQTGKLLSVELIFCDNTGLQCIICDANAGTFDMANIQICEDENIPDSVFIPEFAIDTPDVNFTNYDYLLSSDNISYTVQSVISGVGWPIGNYTICGLSYAVLDSSKLFDQLDTMTFAEVQVAFGSDAIDHCADLSSPCIRVNVYEIPDTTRLVESICNGSVYQVGDEIFRTPGMYIVDLKSIGGCDSIVALDLSVVVVSASITQLDTLSCDNSSTILSAAGSDVPGIPRYRWATTGGTIIGSTFQSSLIIGSSGVYTVTVTDVQSGCTSERSWDAITDGSEPFVQLSDGVIGCLDTIFTFEPIVFPLDVVFEWTGPGGYSDSVPNPSVSTQGTYYLTVTDAAGCSAVTQADVSYDTLTTISTKIRVIKDCNLSKTVVVIDPSGQLGYSWTGPGGYTSASRIVVTAFPGTYVVEVMQANGCVVTDSISVDLDYTIPSINITAAKDSINCGEMILLSASSSLNQTIFSWSGSGVNITDTNQISAKGPGAYIVEGMSPNLCIGTDTVILYPGLGLSDVLTFTDTITCDKDTVTIGVISLGQVINYRWTGPGMIDSTLNFIRVFADGIYQVEMTDISGCVQRASVEVILNTMIINFGFIADTITCDQPVAGLTFVANAQVRYFEWLLPNSQIVTDSIIPVTTNERYTLTVVGENGCQRVRKFRVVVDTLKPLFFIESASYGCYDSIQLSTFLPDSVTGLQWTGPNGYTSNDANPYIYESGSYALSATGLNGCADTKEVQIGTDTIPPVFSPTSELLDCIDSTAILQVSSPDTLVTFQWYFSGMPVGDSSSLIASTPGEYRIMATAPNNCLSFDTIYLAPPVIPVVYAREDTINCRDISVDLNAVSDSSNMDFTWYDPMGVNIGFGPTLNVISPGVYRLAGQWTNGCIFDTTVVVYIDTLRPIAVASTAEVIKCLIQEIYLSAEASLGDSLLFEWTSPNGDILLGQNSDSAYIHGAGQYILKVEELVNHCTNTDTLNIVELNSTLESMILSVIPECLGNRAGVITFDSVYLAETPLIYSIGLNGGSLNPVFDSLAMGEYNVSVIDSFGCSLDSIIAITETSTETVDLGPDIDILIGDPATLIAKLNIDSSILSAISWEPVMPCNSCLSNIVYPSETQSFVINVRDAGGCIASDQVTVFVQERGQFFVPNVFTPNNDGINDLLTLNVHAGVAWVNHFRIMDRSGNQVFGSENKDPHTVQIAWDGRFNGEDLNPAVFAYVLEIVLVTGRVEVHSGDITLLR